MASLNVLKKENKEGIEFEVNIKDIKSVFIFKRIFNFVTKLKLLDVIKYNKNSQKKLNININNYKEYSNLYSKIELEIKVVDKMYGKFINIIDKEEISYFHIYFNNNEIEIKRNYLKENDKVSVIKIIIDYKVKSLSQLFQNCDCIESINIKKFYRNNIKDMSKMFYRCSSLKEIIFSAYNVDNIENMSNMFFGCSSLKELNLSNFNTNNLKDMAYMLSGCSSLKKLDLSNFITNNVIDMSFLFDGCSSLIELNVSSFNTKFVMYMNGMFHGCSSLKELDISNFRNSDLMDVSFMFDGCKSLKKLKIGHFNITNVSEKKYF